MRAGTEFDERWADIWPRSAELEELLRTTATPADGGEHSTLTQLNSSLGKTYDGYQEFATRPTRWAPIAAALLGAAFDFVAVFIRRLELAADLHADIAPSDLALKMTAEGDVWISLAVALASPLLAVGVGMYLAEDRPCAPSQTLTLLLTGAASTLLGSLLALTTIRENHLHR